MCNVCRDWELGKLTLSEAWRNLDEMKEKPVTSDEEQDHFWEVAEMLSNQDES